MPKTTKPRKKYRPRPLLTDFPSLADIQITMRPLDHLMDQLVAGEILVANGRAVVLDWQSEYCEVAPALQGWIECFERICAGENIHQGWSGLRAIALALRDDAELTSSMITAARRELTACRAILRRVPRSRIGSYMRTEMIAIEQEASGAAPRRTLDVTAGCQA